METVDTCAYSALTMVTRHRMLSEVQLGPLDPRRFQAVLSAPAWEVLLTAMGRAGEILGGRTLFNVNSTPRGGGVAEMLQGMIAYVRGAGVDGRWLVIEGNPEFFAVTKRLHNKLHGHPGDGGDLDETAREVYEGTLAANAQELVAMMGPRDVVLLHDPQTAGLVDAVKATGATVLWRCHVGVDVSNEHTREAWDFLRGYVDGADANVFSRRAFVWEGLDESKVEIVPPSIDAFSPKNQELDPMAVTAILHATGVMLDGEGAQPLYQRVDGTFARVQRKTVFMDDDDPIPNDVPFVLQVSRWDRLKDPLGVMRGFADHIADGTHLVLAGPAVEAIADDPEGKEVLDEAVELWRSFPPDLRERVHLLALPMDDIQENAAIVNALQRRAHIVVQKSLAEGFGLTVAEAMWKGRPVIASRAGGIQDQIEHGVSGLLIDDPTDLAEFGRALAFLLGDPERAEEMGLHAKERVRTDFLHTSHMVRYLNLLERLLSSR